MSTSIFFADETRQRQGQAPTYGPLLSPASASPALSLVFSDGLEYEEQVEGEEPARAHAQAGQRLAGGRAKLRVVVRVQGDHAHPDQQGGGHRAQARLLQKRIKSGIREMRESTNRKIKI